MQQCLNSCTTLCLSVFLYKSSFQICFAQNIFCASIIKQSHVFLYFILNETLSACIVTQHLYNAALPKLPQTKLCQILTSCWYFALFNYWSQRLISVGTLPVSQCKHSTKNKPRKSTKADKFEFQFVIKVRRLSGEKNPPPNKKITIFYFGQRGICQAAE